VSIVLNCSNTHIIVKVKDRGPGIPKAFKEKIFQPFYRLETSRNSATGGSGLGLAIVQQLVDSHNWSVSLNPRKTGGTSAVLTIDV
jgi:two-component system osmolarity sensor histidine kinase EnvZ